MQLLHFIAQYAMENMFADSDDDERDKEVRLTKIENYVEVTIANYTGRQFFIHFRMTPATFEILLSRIAVVDPIPFRSGNQETPLEKQLLLTIWYMANMESFR